MCKKQTKGIKRVAMEFCGRAHKIQGGQIGAKGNQTDTYGNQNETNHNQKAAKHNQKETKKSKKCGQGFLERVHKA